MDRTKARRSVAVVDFVYPFFPGARLCRKTHKGVETGVGVKALSVSRFEYK